MKIVKQLKNYISEGEKLGLDVASFKEKLNRLENQMGKGVIRIVLLGSISDGKTSTASALLGEVLDDMKIDPDESSDEIIMYRVHSDGGDYEIVDTPGLFGTKEKEVNFKSMKFSDITMNYISEAHLVLYVCKAVNPLKDSHKEVIRYIMKDLGKLPSTIFVVNGMDGVCDVKDPEDYHEMVEIKTDFVKERLARFLDLSQEEIDDLSIVCISADPKQRGLDYWFEHKDDYMSRSHIDDLKKETEQKIESSNVDELDLETIKSSAYQIGRDLQIIVSNKVEPLETNSNRAEEVLSDINSDVQIVKSEIKSARDIAKDQLDNLRIEVLNDIENADIDSLATVLQEKIGVKEEEVDFHIIEDRSNYILNRCFEASMNAVSSKKVDFERGFNKVDSFKENLISKGAGALKGVKISNTQVLAVRDALNIPHKFKPYGAKKLAGKLTKGLGWFSFILTLGLEAAKMKKNSDNENKLKGLKKDLKSALGDYFKELQNSLTDNKIFYASYAPSYNQLVDILSIKQNEIDELRAQIERLKKYNDEITTWVKNIAIDYV